MIRKLLFGLFLISSLFKIFAQENGRNFAIGIHYGFGSEFNNNDYTFTNHFCKVQLYYELKRGNHFRYEILVQPEVNFAEHQLLNFYFVKPEEPNYIEKREEYTKLKPIHEYVLNLGFLVRKPVSKSCSFYVLGSIGPMITDTETERMSKGFAFSDVLAIGFTTKLKKLNFDVRPSIRHVSNAGITDQNSGYNTKNIEFGISYLL
jgi:hypothetical protein